ncbi:AGAP009355-PA [Anopheles gambiae str. PEST]|uniref:AGAP009355-PA n=3 Tax=gambiae species complex TaxID=44542 RepID=Q7PSD8_ANOGA|nr:AGAP009357-PA [Anopheles gambiae str. PEST]EAU77425.1 AGAP009355-PA [Anopheles gambiae str. PEST]
MKFFVQVFLFALLALLGLVSAGKMAINPATTTTARPIFFPCFDEDGIFIGCTPHP